MLVPTPTAHNCLRKSGISRYFFVFCVVEEVLLVVTGDKVVFIFFVNYVINGY